jgi:hypothetical protein
MVRFDQWVASGGVGWRRVQGVADHLIDLGLGDDGLAATTLVHLAHPADPVGLEVAPPLQHGRA